MRLPALLLVSLSFAAGLPGSFAAGITYENDFEKTTPGPMPEGLNVLGGKFTVTEADGNRFVELPGAPLETFAFTFGPTIKSNATARARIFGTAQGRRLPAFAVSVGGVAGFRLQVSPARRAIEVLRGDTLKTSIPFTWKDAQWTHLEISQQFIKDGEWRVDGRVWFEGEARPDMPQITFTDSKSPPSGPAAVWGLPISGTPIRFDDIKVVVHSLKP